MPPKLKSTSAPKNYVAGPPWLTPDKLQGKQACIRAKMGIGLVPPTTFHKDLYPSYVIDDANRPKVFDCHLLQVTGYLIWPYEDSQHLELHIEHNSIRLYSHRQITQYRTQHANITGENLVVAPRAKGSKKPNSKRGVTAAIVRSIYHDVHAFSPTSTVALPGQASTEPGKAPTQVNPQANANLPLLPLSLDFSLRDVTQLWLDTAFRHIAHITFQSGFALGLLLSDAEALVHSITHKLRLLHIYCVKIDNVNKQTLFRRAIALAKESFAIREAIASGSDRSNLSAKGSSQPGAKSPMTSRTKGGRGSVSGDMSSGVNDGKSGRVYVDPYDESYILQSVAKALKARDARQDKKSKYASLLSGIEDAVQYGLLDDDDDDDNDDEMSTYDGLYLAMRRNERIALDEVDDDDNDADDSQDEDDVDEDGDGDGDDEDVEEDDDEDGHENGAS